MKAGIGDNLGPYRLIELLGEGGMGQVYLAEDPRLGRNVALKLLPEDMAGDHERLERFEREARAVAALNHPGIVTIHSIEEVDGRRFITMECVQGETLGALIPEGGMPLQRLLPVATQIADALSTAHEAGITHRDLKPDNVMVGADGRVKILDFGLAKLRQPRSDEMDPSEGATASVTRDGRIVGTVAYMSPEQAQGKPVDSRSDIFSLGVLLFEMATGRRPFTGDTNITVLSSILKDAPAAVSQLRSEVPRPLERAIARSLEKDPHDRYQSALDLRKDLDDLRRDVESGELLPSRHSLPALLSPGRGRSLLPVGLAAAAVALVALVFAFASPEPAAAPERESATLASDSRPSLAVFHFENLTQDPELEWLRTGLADMLVTDLSQSPDLRVLDTARLNQILARAGGAGDGRTSFEVVQAVADETRIETAVVGSYMRAGETLRISARLQNIATGEVLGSESVEGPGGEALFGLVDELTQRIRSRFELARASAGLDRDLKEVTTSSLQAYRAFVEGARLHERLEEEEARVQFERALELDPDFAMAMAKLSVVHGNLKHGEESRRYAERALEHVDRLSDRERLYIEGRYYSLDPTTLERGLAAYAEAVERFPDHTSARNNLAQGLTTLGRYGEAIHHLEELRRQGMTFPGSYESLARARAAIGEPEKGLEVLEEYVRRNPESPQARLYLANFLIGLGRVGEAVPELTRAVSLGADTSDVALSRAAAALLVGDLADAVTHAEQLRSREPSLGRALLAIVSAWRGELDAAVAGLEAAMEEPGSRKFDMSLIAPALLIDADRPEEALAFLDSLPGPAPDAENPFAPAFQKILRAVALREAGDDRAAAAEAKEVRPLLERLPDSFVVSARTSVLALLAFAEGRDGEARQLLEESLSQHRPNPMGWDQLPAQASSMLAHFARQEGDTADERVWLERLERTAQGRLLSPVAWVRGQYRLAELLDAAGEAEAAAQRYATFLHYWGEGDIFRDDVARARQRFAALGGDSD